MEDAVTILKIIPPIGLRPNRPVNDFADGVEEI
jgi:hypothetical protein